MRIFVASPYRAETPEGREANLRRTLDICREIALEGHAPMAPQVLYTRFLKDDVEEERQTGIRCGLAFLEACHQVWVYGPVSEGMRAEIEAAGRLGIPVVEKA
jgi:hypothetical protein